MKILSVFSVVYLLQAAHWEQMSATAGKDELYVVPKQGLMTDSLETMHRQTEFSSAIPRFVSVPSNTGRLAVMEHGPGYGEGLSVSMVGVLRNKTSEEVNRKDRLTVDLPKEKSSGRRRKRDIKKNHHSKEKETRGKHSREKYSGHRHKKPKGKKGSRVRRSGHFTPMNWPSWRPQSYLIDSPTRRFGSPHIPAFVPLGSGGVPSFIPSNPMRLYAPSIPNHFPRHPYYPSYVPGLVPSVPYHPGWGGHPGLPHNPPTLGTTTTTQRPVRRTRAPKPPRRTTTPFFSYLTTSAPKPIIKAPVTWPNVYPPLVTTTTEAPELVSMTTYISQIFTATSPTIGNYPNGVPVTLNIDAETIPPLVRINQIARILKRKDL